MKLPENFVGDLLQAVRSSQGKSPAAASAVIQDALRSAGLMPGAPAPAARGASQFVDLNAAPTWAGKQAAAEPVQAPDGIPAGLREAFAGMASKFKMPQPGQAKARTLQPDPKAPGQFLDGEFSNEAGSRRYRLYIPSRPSSTARPLVVMLHGCQQDASDFAAGTAMNALAEQHDCLVLYPEQARSANGSNCWNWFDPQHQQHDGGEPAIIAGMTRQVLREHGADDKRVYAAGLSAGGAMAAILGASCPDLFAAVGVHSGLAAGSAHDLMSALNTMKGAHGKRARQAGAARGRVPAIVFHGDQDGTVHLSNGEAVLKQFGAGDRALREVEESGQSGAGRGYTKTTSLDQEGRAVLESWIVHGAGHAWAGGSAAGSYTDGSGPDASAEMLRFFLQQRLA